jgi:AcrR family transcriptional regulator
VAARAGIAAGTVYRYFPAKAELVAEMLAQAGAAEVTALAQAAAAAPGPVSALAATVTTLAARLAAAPRLALALWGEPVEAGAMAARETARAALIALIAERLAAAQAAERLAGDAAPALFAEALFGALLAALAPAPGRPEAVAAGAAVPAMTLFALRAIGLADARARGHVAQALRPAPPRPAPGH